MAEQTERVRARLDAAEAERTPENKAAAVAARMEEMATRDPALAVALGEVRTNIVLSGLPCAIVADARPTSPSIFEVTCIKFRGERSIARYRVNNQTGRATRL
jgi:hypothetical protein